MVFVLFFIITQYASQKYVMCYNKKYPARGIFTSVICYIIIICNMYGINIIRFIKLSPPPPCFKDVTVDSTVG